MLYGGDYHHFVDGSIPVFEETLRRGVARLDGGAVVAERECYAPAKKRRIETLYDGVPTGETNVSEVEGGYVLSRRSTDSERVTGSHAALVEAMREHPDAVESVHLGPVLSERTLSTREVMERLLGKVGPDADPAMREQLHRTTAEWLRLRDQSMVEAFDEKVDRGVVDPDNTLVLWGGTHNLDRRLNETYRVRRLNAEVPPTNEFAAAAKRLDQANYGLDDPVPRAEFARPAAVARPLDEFPTELLGEVRRAYASDADPERLVGALAAKVETFSDDDVHRLSALDARRLAEAPWLPGPDRAPDEIRPGRGDPRPGGRGT